MIDIKECDTADFCGSNATTVCTELLGNYSCDCKANHTLVTIGALNNLTCDRKY